MFAGVTCACVAAVVVAVFAAPSAKEKRSYTEGVYWSAEDASIASDGIDDCSDDDSDSVELAYIINKREAPLERLPAINDATGSRTLPPPPQAAGINNAALSSVTPVTKKKNYVSPDLTKLFTRR